MQSNGRQRSCRVGPATRRRPPWMAGGTTARTQEVEPRWERRPRATQGAVAGMRECRERHDCMDAGGRATPGVVAEDEGRFFAAWPSPSFPLPQGEGGEPTRAGARTRSLETDVIEIDRFTRDHFAKRKRHRERCRESWMDALVDTGHASYLVVRPDFSDTQSSRFRRNCRVHGEPDWAGTVFSRILLPA